MCYRCGYLLPTSSAPSINDCCLVHSMISHVHVHKELLRSISGLERAALIATRLENKHSKLSLNHPTLCQFFVCKLGNARCPQHDKFLIWWASCNGLPLPRSVPNHGVSKVRQTEEKRLRGTYRCSVVFHKSLTSWWERTVNDAPPHLEWSIPLIELNLLKQKRTVLFLLLLLVVAVVWCVCVWGIGIRTMHDQPAVLEACAPLFRSAFFRNLCSWRCEQSGRASSKVGD